jgi:hypothetical protein
MQINHQKMNVHEKRCNSDSPIFKVCNELTRENRNEKRWRGTIRAVSTSSHDMQTTAINTLQNNKQTQPFSDVLSLSKQRQKNSIRTVMDFSSSSFEDPCKQSEATDPKRKAQYTRFQKSATKHNNKNKNKNKNEL